MKATAVNSKMIADGLSGVLSHPVSVGADGPMLALVSLLEGEMSDVTRFNFHVEQAEGEELRLRFQEPLDRDAGPSSARLLAAAIGTCLAESFFRCLRKCGGRSSGFAADASVSIVHDEMERLHVGSVAVVFEDMHVELATEVCV